MSHPLAYPTLADKEGVMGAEFHRHRSSSELLRSQVLVHGAATIENLGVHAHLAVNAFLWIYVVGTSSNGDSSRPTDRFALKAFPAGIELPDLVADHPLQIVMISNVHGANFHGIVIAILIKRLDRENRHLCAWV